MGNMNLGFVGKAVFRSAKATFLSLLSRSERRLFGLFRQNLLRSTLAIAISTVALLPLVDAAERDRQLLSEQDESGVLVGWASFSEDPNVKVGDVWKLAKERLSCKGTPKGYLYTKKDYTNFVLKLQWRWTSDKQPANGGVLVRMTGPHKIWPKSLEAQINAGDAGDFWGLAGYHLTGPSERSKLLKHPKFGVLTNVRKMRAVEKPMGQWNQYEITAKADVVTLKINGELVNRATGCDVVSGRICLTAEGSAIEFRDVQLTPLDEID